MSKRISYFGAVMVLILSIVVTACSSGNKTSGASSSNSPESTSSSSSTPSSSEEKVTISYLDNIPSPERTALLKEIIGKFESKYPNIKVEYSSVAFEESYKKLMVMGASQSLPDVFNVDESMLGTMIPTGYLENLQSYVDKWDQKENLIEGVKNWPSKYKGDYYAVPDAFMLQALFIRSDWFKEKSLQPRIDTWDQYFEYGKQLTDAAKGQYGISFRGGPNGIVRYMEYLASLTETPGWFDADGNPITSKPEALEAFKKILRGI
ncbi:hypothetical protein SD71_03560 [Cohnella kolymensis]|uniref:ABC transporter substrate-binding protein n=1 Tax=Cohnella kolymensis TaxID=1590652 RepID=A0ABR5A9F3_9BACL|nr:extracellular solute-binding protein [Cohnella kolymensis]KIL37679.1 hypothetical protein SD71_03560 [Cohnella kolymensis]